MKKENGRHDFMNDCLLSYEELGIILHKSAGATRTFFHNQFNDPIVRRILAGKVNLGRKVYFKKSVVMEALGLQCT